MRWGLTGSSWNGTLKRLSGFRLFRLWFWFRFGAILCQPEYGRNTGTDSKREHFYSGFPEWKAEIKRIHHPQGARYELKRVPLEFFAPRRHFFTETLVLDVRVIHCNDNPDHFVKTHVFFHRVGRDTVRKMDLTIHGVGPRAVVRVRILCAHKEKEGVQR